MAKKDPHLITDKTSYQIKIRPCTGMPGKDDWYMFEFKPLIWDGIDINLFFTKKDIVALRDLCNRVLGE